MVRTHLYQSSNRNQIAGPQEVINIYLLSLAFADLILGLVIVPLSIYPALESCKL